MSEFFFTFLMLLCMDKTDNTYSQSIYLFNFFFTVIQVACYLKDGGLTSFLTYVP